MYAKTNDCLKFSGGNTKFEVEKTDAEWCRTCLSRAAVIMVKTLLGPSCDVSVFDTVYVPDTKLSQHTAWLHIIFGTRHAAAE